MNRPDERGSAAIEAVVVAPAVVALIGLVILGGRVALAHQAVQAVADSAARAASLARTADAAETAARDATRAGLDQDLPCASHQLHLDLDGFTKPVGTPASVTATLSCDLAVAELAIPGLPGTLTVRATMSSPLDTHRERR